MSDHAPSTMADFVDILSNSSNYSESQVVQKPAVKSREGLVSAQQKLAAMAGAIVLEDGGNAVDAAVATAFALGVVEPWMSGPGGGGIMVIYNAETQKPSVVDFNMRSPSALDLAAYPLVDGRARDIFPWPRVRDDANLVGAKSIAVPGMVDGMGLAHTRFGRKKWAQLLAPAIYLAKQGPRIDWYTTLMTAASVPDLAADPVASKVFLRNGLAPATPWTVLADDRFDFSKMAETLSILATEGPRSFYEGELSRGLADDVRELGGFLSVEDLKHYRARELSPLEITHGTSTIWLTPELTAGSTCAAALSLLGSDDQYAAGRSKPNASDYANIAHALQSAQKVRLATMGDVENGRTQTCTTSFATVDKDGNMVCVTQTLLSIFGSKVMLPRSGLLMNNGILWFNPEQDHPNSLAPNKSCLTNICPLIGNDGHRMFALGASGGRKIMSSVLQLTSFLTDFDMSLEDAFHHPRIDCSTPGQIVADDRLDADVVSILEQTSKVTSSRRTVYPYAFACPSGVERQSDQNLGTTETASPWADTCSAAMVRAANGQSPHGALQPTQ